jgi:hypothetical protein
LVSFTQILLVTCGQLLYFPIFGQRKLSRVFYSCDRYQVPVTIFNWLQSVTVYSFINRNAKDN